MEKKALRIGLALSGGGMRAAVYHLGVLKYLAEEGLLKKVTHLSTVSGASIGIGLLYARSNYRWPGDFEYLSRVLPRIKEDITKQDIQWSALLRLLVSPYYWNKKVHLLAKVMEKKWNLNACLQDIPKVPLWTINTTTYETGKDFRISNKKMGAQNSFVIRPRLRLSHAMGASAGFPIWIGPYKMKTSDYIWSDRSATMTVRPNDEVLHLWDGGIYDNMGLDPLFQFIGENQLREDLNYLIVSNASSAELPHKSRGFGYSLGNLKRLLDISMHQSQSLRKHEVIDFFKETKKGLFLQIGDSAKDIIRKSDLEFAQKEELIHGCMREAEVMQVANYKTTLEKLSPVDFDRILTHGYESAKLNILCYGHLS